MRDFDHFIDHQRLIADTLTAEEIQEWDEFVATAPISHFYQKYQWGEFEKSQGHRIKYFILRDQLINGKIAAVALMVYKKFPLTGKMLCEVACGPAARDTEFLSITIQIIDEYCSRKSLSLELGPRNLEDHDWITAKYKALGFSEVKEPGYHTESSVVDLKPTEEEILRSFRQTTRHEIRDGVGMDIKIDCGNGEYLIDRFFDLYETHSMYAGMKPKSLKFFTYLWGWILGGPENGFMAVAEWKEKILSAAIFIRNGKKIWYTWGASDRDLRASVPTSHLLQWRAMQYAKAQGCEWFDMGGFTPGTPVAVFKSGFSKNMVKYLPNYRKVYSPFLMRLIRLKRRFSK